MGSAPPVRVAIDVETTGLQAETDAIIEVGAIRFRGDEILDTFESLIQPNRPIPYRIQRLTHITPAMLAGAPTFDQIASRLRAFLEDLPLVGQSVGFDAGFLRRMNLAERNPLIDTFELATLVLPSLSGYSLESIAAALGVAPPPAFHRALADARLARDVLLALEQRIARMSDGAIVALCALGSPSVLPSLAFLRDELRARGLDATHATRGDSMGAALIGQLGFDPAIVGMRVYTLGQPAPDSLAATDLHTPAIPHASVVASATAALSEAQIALVELSPAPAGIDAVLRTTLAWAVEERKRLVVAATSMAAARALAQTHLPRALAAMPGASNVTVATLFEPQDYLCLHRWFGPAREAVGLGPDGLRGMARLTSWLFETPTGARDAVSLGPVEQIAWDAVAASHDEWQAPDCAYRAQGWCFAGRARAAAEQAQVLVTTHTALLPMQPPPGAPFVPPADGYVILDAHQLEERALAQVSTVLAADSLLAGLGALWRSGGRGSGLLLKASQELPGAPGRENWSGQVTRARDAVDAFFKALAALLHEAQAASGAEAGAPLRFDAQVHTLPAWASFEAAWKTIEKRLMALAETLTQAATQLRKKGADALAQGLATRGAWLRQIISQGTEIVTQPRDDRVAWARPVQSFPLNGPRSRSGMPEDLPTLHSAPARMAPLIGAALSRLHGGIVLAGTALMMDGRFDETSERLGLPSGIRTTHAAVDFTAQTLLIVPSDAPEPNTPSYQRTLGEAIVEVATALRGRTVVLFASHTALRATYAAIKPTLEARDVLVLAQGIDGSLRQVWQHFRTQERIVLLGAGGMWEGWESENAHPACIFVARLPLAALGDPLTAARAEGLHDPMRQLIAPQAALRLRQALNALAWSDSRRNVVIVYDRRVIAKDYGELILHTLPSTTRRDESMSMLPALAREWLDGDLAK
jgi:ATP-dependent DNA helicase DinG